MKDRYNKILELLTKEKKIEVNELSQILGVSNVTIRKDLDALEEKGIIKRGHGYAILANKDDINGRLAYHYEIKKRIAQKAVKNTKTLGMSMGPCTVPASGKASFYLEEDEIEMGLGIHGEPGTHKEKLKTADEHVEYMLNKILDEHKLSENDRVAVMINGLGATPLMELYIVNRKVSEMLQERKIEISETLVGNYMTSLEMPGFSITILKLDKELEKYLKFKAETPAYKN